VPISTPRQGSSRRQRPSWAGTSPDSGEQDFFFLLCLSYECTADVATSIWTAAPYDNTYTIALAQTLQSAGYEILLDFHFSDTWADPTDQVIPSGWPTTVSALETKIQDYVEVTLYDFKEAGVEPTIVALGNEITNGMLFPAGEIVDNDFDDFALLWAAARKGVSLAVSSYGVTQPKIMIHLNNGWDEATVKWWYSGVLATGTVTTDDFDIMVKRLGSE
jgi:arabinogalactan endo-1,4-beta-galactosidase